jgi:hypothetical protein
MAVTVPNPPIQNQFATLAGAFSVSGARALNEPQLTRNFSLHVLHRLPSQSYPRWISDEPFRCHPRNIGDSQLVYSPYREDSERVVGL